MLKTQKLFLHGRHIVKRPLWPYLSSILSDFRKILYVDAKSDNNYSQRSQMSNFDNLYWRRSEQTTV